MTKKKTKEPGQQPTCEDRIADQLGGRLRDIELLYAVIDGDLDEHTEDAGELEEYREIDTQEAMDRIRDLPLCADMQHTVVIQLSTGGPGDQFECDVYRNDGERFWRIDEIRYRFLDWFDGAVRTLSGSEFELAERFCSYFIEVME